MKVKKIFENTFAAVAYAEYGVGNDELNIPNRYFGLRAIVERLRDTFTAVAFAEANCHNEALLILNKKYNRPTLKKFLEDVGLSHVPVRICVIDM